MQTIPYVTVSAFKAHPTFLDLLNLRSGDSNLADQVEQLNEILIEASNEADNYCEQPLAAHTTTDNIRLRTDRQGRVIHKPFNTPVVSVSSVLTGNQPSTLSSLSLTNLWIEDARSIVAFAQPFGLTSSAGPLQFGSVTADSELYTQWTYVAGYANTVLTSTANSGASSIPVADATGIVPGQVLRILDPGNREAVTVSSTFVPTTGPASVTLAGTLAHTHSTATDSVGVSALPPDVHKAVIMYAVAILLRRTDTPANTAFPGALAKPSASTGSHVGMENLIEDFMRTLEPFRRVR